ncbi:hypothetical protein KIN20_035383 [Parelaphostrongylus tenuis]|uniref:Uncharacterized protein n=1 Tax=Parelaphostrongylus tenuis TaxID=148309 RepID=A0AAD5WJN0_PARTN|nr:hypothetical protein KIN20_035383 [Parelaphostrongylus tenuis]
MKLDVGDLQLNWQHNLASINFKLYCEQLERVYNALKEKYPTLIRRKRAALARQCQTSHCTQLRLILKNWRELSSCLTYPTIQRLRRPIMPYASSQWIIPCVDADSRHLIKLNRHVRSIWFEAKVMAISSRSGSL